MILLIKVEVSSAAGEAPLCARDLRIEADPDVLFVPSVAQATQAMVAKSLKEAEKEIYKRDIRTESRKGEAGYTAATE